jgi:hypothetical protein
MLALLPAAGLTAGMHTWKWLAGCTGRGRGIWVGKRLYRLLLSEAQRGDLLKGVEGQLLEGLASPVTPMTGADWAWPRQ